MDQELMSNEENYCFDIAGYLPCAGRVEPGRSRTTEPDH